MINYQVTLRCLVVVLFCCFPLSQNVHAGLSEDYDKQIKSYQNPRAEYLIPLEKKLSSQLSGKRNTFKKIYLVHQLAHGYFWLREPDNAKKWSELGLDLLGEQDLPELEADFNVWLGDAILTTGSGFYDGFSALTKGLSISKVNSNISQYHQILLIRGYWKTEYNLLQGGLSDVKEAYEYFQNSNDTREIASALNLLALNFDYSGNSTMAVDYYQQALALESELDFRDTEVIVFNLAILYLKLQQIDNANPLIDTFCAPENVSDMTEAHCARLQAERFLLLKEYEKAYDGFQRSFGLFSAICTEQCGLVSLMGAIEALMLQKKYPEADELITRMEDLLAAMDGEFNALMGIGYRIDYLEQTENWKAAFLKQKEANELGMAQHEKINEEQFLTMRMNVDYTNQRYQNKLLRQENQIISLEKEAALQSSKNKTTLLTVGLVVLLILGALLAKLVAMQKRLKHLSMTDPLTRALNRRGIMARLDKLLRQHPLQYPCSGAAILDFDGFKALNDTQGHDAGDLLLTDFALLCEEYLPSNAYHGRLGGDEWLLLIPDMAVESVAELINELREKFVEKWNEQNSGTCKVSFSAGVAAIVKGVACSPRDIMKAADEALYRAKNSGKNRVFVAESRSD